MILFLWLSFLSIAEEPADEGSEDLEADEEIIVYGQREVDRRRAVLDKSLREKGYRKGIRKGDKVHYRPEVVWKPTVVVYDSGFVVLRRTPPRFEPWVGGRKDNKWRYLSCIPPFTPMCVKASGWLITKRKAQHSKTQVVEENINSIHSWQEAVAVLATQARLEEDIPDALDSLWSGDSPLSQQQRKEEILRFWSTRTCTPEGERAANVIADFIAMEIQHSESPVSTTEKQVAEEQSKCNRILPVQAR